jgi:hypothetical protein
LRGYFYADFALIVRTNACATDSAESSRRHSTHATQSQTLGKSWGSPESAESMAMLRILDTILIEGTNYIRKRW